MPASIGAVVSCGIAGDSHGRLQKAFGLDDLQDLAALDTFNQNFNISVWKLQTLDDVDDGANLKYVSSLGLVDRGVVLGGKKDLLIAGQSFLERAYARLPAHHERRHHVGEDDHVRMGIMGSFLLSNFSF